MARTVMPMFQLCTGSQVTLSQFDIQRTVYRDIFL